MIRDEDQHAACESVTRLLDTQDDMLTVVSTPLFEVRTEEDLMLPSRAAHSPDEQMFPYDADQEKTVRIPKMADIPLAEEQEVTVRIPRVTVECGGRPGSIHLHFVCNPLF